MSCFCKQKWLQLWSVSWQLRMLLAFREMTHVLKTSGSIFSTIEYWRKICRAEKWRKISTRQVIILCTLLRQLKWRKKLNAQDCLTRNMKLHCCESIDCFNVCRTFKREPVLLGEKKAGVKKKSLHNYIKVGLSRMWLLSPLLAVHKLALKKIQIGLLENASKNQPGAQKTSVQLEGTGTGETRWLSPAPCIQTAFVLGLGS